MAAMPCNLTRITRPSNPASETSRLLPPPSTKSATPRSPAQASASAISSSLEASTNQRAGPPMPKVVKGASGLFSSRSIKVRVHHWSMVQRRAREASDLPNGTWILGNPRVGRQKSDPFDHGLSDQDAVEGISVD